MGLSVDKRSGKDRRHRAEPGRRVRLPQEALSLQSFCDIMGVHENTGRRWVSRGYVLAFRCGPRLIRIPRSEVSRMRRYRKLDFIDGMQRYETAPGVIERSF